MPDTKGHRFRKFESLSYIETKKNAGNVPAFFYLSHLYRDGIGTVAYRVVGIAVDKPGLEVDKFVGVVIGIGTNDQDVTYTCLMRCSPIHRDHS